MRILVTGGAGFIGSHIVDRYVKAGHTVGIVDDFSTGKEENLIDAAKSGRLTIFETDIRDADEMARILERFRPEVVNHHAATIDVTWCEANQEEAFEINVDATAALGILAKEADVRRFIFASSAAVYGECDQPATEGQPPTPVGIYGASKLAAEIHLQSIALESDSEMVAVILRYSNVYGARSECGVIPLFLDRWANGERPTIYGDGEQSRDFIHVADVAAANLSVLSKPAFDEGYRTFNISTGQTINVNRLWVLLTTEAGEARPEEILQSCLDSTRARHELGFEALIDVGQGLASLRLMLAATGRRG